MGIIMTATDVRRGVGGFFILIGSMACLMKAELYIWGSSCERYFDAKWGLLGGPLRNEPPKHETETIAGSGKQTTPH